MIDELINKIKLPDEIKKQMELDLMLYRKNKVDDIYMLNSINTYKNYGYDINAYLKSYLILRKQKETNNQ